MVYLWLAAGGSCGHLQPLHRSIRPSMDGEQCADRWTFRGTVCSLITNQKHLKIFFVRSHKNQTGNANKAIYKQTERLIKACSDLMVFCKYMWRHKTEEVVDGSVTGKQVLWRMYRMQLIAIFHDQFNFFKSYLFVIASQSDILKFPLLSNHQSNIHGQKKEGNWCYLLHFFFNYN